MKNKIFADIDCRQINCHRDPTCGDHFIMRHIKGQRRAVAVLSDGMGHGVKANILSSLTSSIIVNMMESRENIKDIARTILSTLPICSIRKLSYCTFTIVDIDLSTGRVDIIEYDNPQSIVMRGSEPLPVEWDCQVLSGGTDSRTRRTLMTTSFTAQVDDRIIFMSDGVPQSGLGTDQYSFGWGRANVISYIKRAVAANGEISAYELSSAVLSRAIEIDDNKPKDDISCATIHFREPRRILFCSCPPSVGSTVSELATKICDFQGCKVISGYPLAELVAKEFGVEPIKRLTSDDPEIPPTWTIQGVDLVTEGLITLSKVLEILQNYKNRHNGTKGGAWALVNMLLEADVVEMVIGLKGSSPAIVQDQGAARWHDEFVLRRKVINAIARELENNYGKYIEIIYN